MLSDQVLGVLPLEQTVAHLEIANFEVEAERPAGAGQLAHRGSDLLDDVVDSAGVGEADGGDGGG